MKQALQFVAAERSHGVTQSSMRVLSPHRGGADQVNSLTRRSVKGHQIHSRSALSRSATKRNIRRVRAGSLASATKRSNSANIIFAAALFFLLLTKVWIRIGILDSGYQLEAMRQEIIASDAKLRELRSSRASTLGAASVQNLAEDKLALRLTKPQQIREIVLP